MFKRFHHTIVGRMFLYVIVPTVIIFALVVALAASGGFKNLRNASEDRMQAEVSLVALEIDAHNSRAVLSAQRMAEAQVAGMFGDRQTSLQYARLVLENFTDVTGAYIGYEPNADGKDAESLGKLPAEAMDNLKTAFPGSIEVTP